MGLSSIPDVVCLVWAAAMLSAGPLNAVVARRAVPKPVPKRSQVYRSAVRGLGFLGILTLCVDGATSRIGVRTFLTLPLSPALVEWTILTILACLSVSVIFLLIRRSLKRPLPLSVVSLLPRRREELAGAFGVVLTAGLVEEYVFRGFVLMLLVSATGSPLLSFLLVTASFGVGHGYQDLLGVVRATLAGGLLALPVLALGTLLPSILAHITIDAFAMISGYSTLLTRLGLIPTRDPSTGTDSAQSMGAALSKILIS